ncbi:unnamed protein product, partial [Symbiodinium necroappetens]
MIHLFVEARRQWDIFSQAPTAPQPQATTAAAPAAGHTPTGAATAAHIPDRPPKTFAAWTQQVTAYEEKLFDGKRRTFPVQELLGTEEVLARMWFEHTVTKMYTPVTLGEVLCRRTWTPGRMLNPLAGDRAAKSAGSKALRLEHGALVPAGPSEWSPRGLLSTIDGANAARWAWILLGIGEEADVSKYADWFVAKARAHADMVPAIQAFWHKSAWTIAMALRNSTSFGEAVKGVMNDVATWQEIIIANADYDDRGAWGGGNGRKRRRPGKPKGKGRDGKDQDPAKKTDAANQQDQGWWSTRGGGKQQNQQQTWWGHAGAEQRHQNTDGGDRPWRRPGVPDRTPKKIRLSARVPPGAEVDRAAIQVADYHTPGIRHRGDLTEYTPEDLAAEIQHIDGQAECIIIFAAAPPCQDFSRVGDRDGHAGNRGYLFNFTAEFLDELRRRLAPRRFGFLVENVEMTPADAAEASKQLGCQPVFADAADFGWIGRTAPDSFDLDGLKFSDAVASGRIRLPCSTTPAADERGRPPPRSRRGKVTTEVQQRWLQDSRQFAPWHYQRDAMLADDQGKPAVLTPCAKEQLHHMPKNFTAMTAQGELEPRTRHRLLGNGWHWGVARRLLLAVLVHAAASLPTTVAIPTAPPTSTIQW